MRAAELLGIHEVPTLKLSHLSEAERHAYVLADNQLALNAGWDQELLAIELQGLIDLDFDVELTGFELAEIDIALAFNDQSGGDDADKVPDPIDGPPITRTGDIWLMGKHRLLCGDAQSRENIDRLVNGRPVDLIFTDPPYNVQVDGNVCGKGSVKHKEFAFASGEMTKDEFTSFLTTTLSNAASVFWQDYKTVMAAKLQKLADEGAAIDEEAFLSHPDVIEINEDLTIRFTGPTTPEALRKCHETMRFRETLILQAELDRRLAPKTDKTAGMGALLFAKNYERLLPARMRYSDSEWLNAVWWTEKINKRTLLKQVRQTWHDALRDRGGKLDTNVKRGFRFPDIKAVQNFCADLHDFCHETTNSDRPISDTDAEELCDIANEFGDQLKRANKP